ncbi:Uncharacterised protein [Janthinobacterium lividum]|nr:hypothetical protein JANLI_34690 [Janthinobacterium lividum]STQ97361.1 Uncharacterised protein [Janthinobacterium lividum]
MSRPPLPVNQGGVTVRRDNRPPLVATPEPSPGKKRRRDCCCTSSVGRPCNDLIAPGMRPAQRAACLYKTAPAIHRLPAPRCPWSGSSVSGQAPCTAFLCRSISLCSWRSCAPRPRRSRNGAGHGRGLVPFVHRSGRAPGCLEHSGLRPRVTACIRSSKLAAPALLILWIKSAIWVKLNSYAGRLHTGCVIPSRRPPFLYACTSSAPHALGVSAVWVSGRSRVITVRYSSWLVAHSFDVVAF